MIRFYILAGFAFLFLQIHLSGNLNKYINTRYAYLSISAIILFAVLLLFEFLRVYIKEGEESKRKSEASGNAHIHDHSYSVHMNDGHSHAPSSKLKRIISYLILFFPIFTGTFLPVQTLDSSFVKAKGFSFPSINVSADNPGYHQFLKPDTSVFYGKAGYDEVSRNELTQFIDRKQVILNDDEYLKGLETIYNFPKDFMGKTISFDGFAYKGDQLDDHHYFVFRFGFIHCVADSGVFGMLVEFPKNTVLQDDQWVHVSGTLSSVLYQPFKQTIPVLKVSEWNLIDTPGDPYVYRVF